MFKLAVCKRFTAYHFLIGGGRGAENTKHSHRYRLEVQLSGIYLDDNGYLLDIVRIEEELDRTVSCWHDRTLNDLPEFYNTNPSVENLAEVAYRFLHKSLWNPKLSSMEVKVWEDDKAWVTYQKE